jgi:hypothetical protein
MHAKETVCRTCGAEEPTPQAILASVPSGQSGGPGMARACICIWAREGGSSSDWLMPGGEGFQGMLMWQKRIFLTGSVFLSLVDPVSGHAAS